MMGWPAYIFGLMILLQIFPLITNYVTLSRYVGWHDFLCCGIANLLHNNIGSSFITKIISKYMLSFISLMTSTLLT